MPIEESKDAVEDSPMEDESNFQILQPTSEIDAELGGLFAGNLANLLKK